MLASSWRVLLRIIVVVRERCREQNMRDRQCNRKPREKTVRGSEAALRKEWNKELASKNAWIGPTPLRTTHKLAIDHRLPNTPNSPAKSPPSLLIATAIQITMVSGYTQSMSATASFSGHGQSSSPKCATITVISTNYRPFINTPLNHVHDQIQFMMSLALAIEEEQRQMPLITTIGASVIRGVEVITFIQVYCILSSYNGSDPAVEGLITIYLC